MTKVLIIGGGIAGSAAALALHKAGIEVAVYEAHPVSSQDGGAFLTLASNGMRALQQVDAATVVAQAGAPLTTMRICDGAGREIATAPIGDQNAATGYRYLTRARLCATLQQEVQRRGIPIRWGKRVIGVACRDRSVTASFDDGTHAHADVLIGADGLNSTIRKLIDPTAPAPRYVGQRVFYGSSTNPGIHSDPDHFQVVRGVAAFGYIVTARNDIWWFARVIDDELGWSDLTPDATPRWRAELAALMRHEEAATTAIVQAARRILVTNAYDLPDVSRWHRTGMLIIGDAAHAASPATGQGASMALEDAVILAKALRDQPGRDPAFATYERLRREPVQANIATSAAMSAQRAATLPSPRSTPSPAAPAEVLDAQLDWNTPMHQM